MNLIHIASWGLARVMARRGKKPKTIAVAYRVPVLLELVATDEAPIVARRDGVQDHDHSVIRSLRGRLVAPVVERGGLVGRDMLTDPALQAEGGLLHIPRPKAPAGSLDDVAWREILDGGEAEAARLASTMAAGFVLVGDILHRPTDAPVWSVKVERKGAVPSVSLAVGRFDPPKAGHTLRFPLSDRHAAFATAERIYRRLGSVQMIWPPRDCAAINVTHPDVFSPAGPRMFSEDLRRELLALGHDQILAVLPSEMRRRWIAVRRLLGSGRIDRAAVVDELSGLASSRSAATGAPMEFLNRVNVLLAVLACRPDTGDTINV